jgi:hypothetical protein
MCFTNYKKLSHLSLRPFAADPKGKKYVVSGYLLMHGNISDNSHYYLCLQPLADGTEH